MAVRYTNIPSSLWTWLPWMSIEDPCARLLWLSFYSSPQSKRCVPGLWAGDVHAMAKMLRFPHDTTWNGLQHLVKSKLVEHDPANELVRLTLLPDTNERAHNDRAVRGWWNRFLSLPDVAIRNVHVHVLWWLVSAAPMNAAMAGAWNETFGQIDVPPNSTSMPSQKIDTSQGSLFQLATPSYEAPSGSPTRIVALGSEIRPSTRPSVGPSARPSTDGPVEGQDQDQDPEQDPDLLFLDQEQRAAPVEISTSAIASCTTDATSPPQANVPFTVDDLVAVVIATQGGFWSVTDRDRASLQREIATLPQPDVGLLSDYLRGNRMPTSDAVDLLSRPGSLTSAFSRAVRWRTEVDKRMEEAAERSAEMARLRAELGV